MSLVTSGLGSNNIVTLGLGQLEEPEVDLGDYISLRETTILVGLENIVTRTEDTVPLTGIYSVEDELSGWEWDKSTVKSANFHESLYRTYLGGHEYGLKEGTIQDYWQSGVVRDIEYLRIHNFRDNNSVTWTPIVTTGAYSVFWEEMPLYSNYSYSTKINVENTVDGLSKISLLPEALESSVSIIMFTRDESLVKRPYLTFKQVEAFTGALEEGSEERKTTVSGTGVIIPENLSERHREFLIDESDSGNSVILNGHYYKEVGKHPGSLKEEYIREVLEDCGVGIGSSRLLYTNYFPVSANTLKVIALKNNGTFEELKQVDTLDFSGPTDAHCVVDEDLGVVTVGGYQAPELVLAEEIDEFDTEILFLPNDLASSSYPDKGIINIGSEKILYYLKGKKGFFECIRGYGGTTPQKHSKFTKIQDNIHGKIYSSEYTFHVEYTAVPRVQYEVLETNLRYANKSKFLDVRPVKNAVSNKIIQISTIEKHVAEVVLETDLPLIGGNLHGPLYYGTDFTQLCATVYDSYGNVVEDIETTIVVEDPIGYLNGTSRTYTALTNSAGQICSVYSVPYDWESISTKVKSVTHEDGNTIMEISERPPGVSSDNVTLFQVLKHDAVLGTVGKKFVCSNGVASESSALPYNSFEVEGFIEWPVNKFENGLVDLLVDDGTSVIKYRREILHTYRIHDSSGKITGMKVILKENVPNIDAAGALSYCWLFEEQAKEWNGLFLDGVNTLVYEWRDDIQHPKTGALGAYFPLRPDIVETKRLVFNNRELPIPEPYNVENNLGGYLAVIPDMVRAHAYARDPVTGRLIVSNSIRIKLDLPSYLKGVDNSNPALPIPYGFTFVTESFNVGSGVGGANFITINPEAEGISSYNLFITPVSRGH